jgi:hypothetical protein
MVTRSKTMELHSDGPERYRLIGRLTDTSFNGDYGPPTGCGDSPNDQVIHDFIVDGDLLGSDLVITRLDVRAETHPYRQCPAILPSCQNLVGKALAAGWRRTVLETLGATAGCTHVTTLLIGLAEARTMAFFLQMNATEAYCAQTRGDGRWTAAGLDIAPSIVNACHVLSSSGPVVLEAQQVASRGAPDVDV